MNTKGYPGHVRAGFPYFGERRKCSDGRRDGWVYGSESKRESGVLRWRDTQVRGAGSPFLEIGWGG